MNLQEKLSAKPKRSKIKDRNQLGKLVIKPPAWKGNMFTVTFTLQCKLLNLPKRQNKRQTGVQAKKTHHLRGFF